MRHLHRFISTFQTKAACCRNIDCTTSNGLELYIICCHVMLLLPFIDIHVYIHMYVYTVCTYCMNAPYSHTHNTSQDVTKKRHNKQAMKVIGKAQQFQYCIGRGRINKYLPIFHISTLVTHNCHINIITIYIYNIFLYK